jgi:NADH:ubiquinone oxidoreductase subunit 5 (subunit L)/multisubunit Na+/H+ antiporter MnhA subunit
VRTDVQIAKFLAVLGFIVSGIGLLFVIFAIVGLFAEKGWGGFYELHPTIVFITIFLAMAPGALLIFLANWMKKGKQ